MKIAAGATFGNEETVVEGKPVTDSVSEAIESRTAMEQETEYIKEHRRTFDLSHYG